MKAYITVILAMCCTNSYAQKIDTRVDNMIYWTRLIAAGVIKPKPKAPVPPAIYTGSKINSSLIALPNSPDVVIDNTPGFNESENSVAINPNNFSKALNSNNVIHINAKVSEFTTVNQGANWNGNVNIINFELADPAATISNDNRYYVGFINDSYGQSVAISTDEGSSWQTYTIASASNILDKNHLWVDKSLASPFVNNVYAAWTDLGGPNTPRIVFSKSNNGGTSWSNGINISQASAGVGQDQGVNINTGPNGEVYATWAIYNSLGVEGAIGFASSGNGGNSFNPSLRIIDNIKGIRGTGISSVIGKGIRTNSFPSMAVDNSFGPNRGSIYVVWANIGTPGINTGSDVDVYLVKSIDNGVSWSQAQKINTSTQGLGKKHFFPWITCDQTTGKLHIIYYDDRNTSSTQCEAWMSSSFDGGITWSDYKISDVTFTPIPIAEDYFGDYLGVSANDDVIYPVWTDNRTGIALAYTSPLISSDFCHNDLTIQNITMPAIATYKYRAVYSISVAGNNTNFVMQGNGTTGARASMVAGNSITLFPNTTIEKGAVLTITPGPCSSQILRPIMASSDEFSKLNIHPKEFEINSRINIYPNPVTDIMYLELSNELQNKLNVNYVLSDLRGSLIFKGLLTKYLNPVNTSKLVSGGYFISFYENEKFIETKKFIKN